MAAQEKNQAQERFANAFVWATRFVAALLFLSAGMKSWQLATLPSLGDGFLYARWFNIFVVEFELAFAIWLLFGMAPRLTRWATMGLFTIFASVSLYKAFSGEASCGCFGAAPINPWATATLDVAIVGALFSCRKVRMTNRGISIKRNIGVIVIWALVGMPLLCIFGSVDKNELLALGTEFFGADGRKIILLEPEKWTNTEFPLLPYIESLEVREKLKTGVWTVILFHFDCEKCKSVIERFSQNEKVVFLHVPSSDGNMSRFSLQNYTELSDNGEWLCETPIVVELDGSKVIATR